MGLKEFSEAKSVGATPAAAPVATTADIQRHTPGNSLSPWKDPTPTIPAPANPTTPAPVIPTTQTARRLGSETTPTAHPERAGLSLLFVALFAVFSLIYVLT